MKILHTSDWHIGKKLKGIDRISEFQEVLNEITEIAINEKVDCIIIAGDIFDSYSPSTEAEKLFYKTMTAINNHNIDIVLFPGNHDSPKKIEAMSIPLNEFGIHVVHETNFDELENNIITIEKNNETLQIAVVPWLNENTLAKINPSKAIEQSRQETGQMYGALLEELFTELVNKLDSNAIRILTSHVLINEAIVRDADQENDISERRLSLDKVTYGVKSSQLPKQINYTALGHIHKPQAIMHDSPVHYAGSILQFSFAEAEQQKVVYIADCHAGEKTTVKTVHLTKGKMLKELIGTYEDVLEQASNYKSEYIKITLTDEIPPKNYRTMLEAQIPNVIDIRIRNQNIQRVIEQDARKQLSELELYKNWLHDAGSDTKLEKKKLAIFKQLFEEVKSNETN